MTVMTKYADGTPCWIDLGSPDLAATQRFYGDLFGWTADDQGEEAGNYTMFRLGDHNVAAAAPQQDPNIPPAWMTYLATSDVDASVGRVEAGGGSVLVPPDDVFEAGRMAIATDPTGAVFGLWQANQHVGVTLANEPGTLSWNQLNTRDVDGAVSFYEQVAGYTVNVLGADDANAPFEYRELQVDGRGVAGMMAMPAEVPAAVPSHWLPYFAVADCDATVDQATAAGASVMVPPNDLPVGRLAVLADPQGAVFAVIRLNQPPA